MSDPAKVRLVRCPKCENLLPELEGYSVYQCGGCGAVLRATKKNLEMDSVSNNSDEEKVQVIEENINKKQDSFSFHHEGKRNSKEGSDSNIRFDSDSSKRDEKLKAEKVVVDDDLEKTETLHDFPRAEIKREFRDSGSSNGTIIGSLKSESFADWRGMDGREFEGILGNRKQDLHNLRYPISSYREDGPSNYPLKPSYGHVEQINHQNVADELNKVKYLEKDRAELLKKLDELKDQISRSCVINDNPKEKVIHNPHMARQEATFTNIPPYARQYNEPSPYFGRQEMGMHRYYDSLSSQMRRTSHQEPNLYFPDHYIHNKMDPYQQPYPNDINLHHPRCPCVQCYKKLPHEPYNPMLYQNENQRSFGFLGHNSNPLGTNKPQSHNSNVQRYGNRRPQRVVMTTGKKRCHHIAGGAPVVSCHSCFHLLELPKKISPTSTNLIKVKCGACSTILLFAIVDKKLVSVTEGADTTANEVINNPTLAVRGHNFHAQGGANLASMNFSSEDYDNSGYDFHCLDRDGQGFGSNISDKVRGFNSTSSYSSENSMKNDSLPTEMEVSFNEDLNNGTSFESGEASRDEDQLRGNKGAQSFFAGIMKKGFKEFSKSSNIVEEGSSNVIINGHPITYRLLKKAEKVAGPVHPGQYWYDFRAGFWGVMGGPCLGIIPPFIEEFNHPMPSNCAGGNTGVFVNGRELHQKDLNLLSSRGLPSAGDRSYIIEISGRVLDEDTGEELASLGKLAPTVEKVKHGFGMKVPRIAA